MSMYAKYKNIFGFNHMNTENFIDYYMARLNNLYLMRLNTNRNTSPMSQKIYRYLKINNRCSKKHLVHNELIQTVQKSRLATNARNKEIQNIIMNTHMNTHMNTYMDTPINMPNPLKSLICEYLMHTDYDGYQEPIAIFYNI